ncbi:5663_t:CDS:1, partial [Dentiscutata heterogama]
NNPPLVQHYDFENEQAHDLDDMIARLPIDNPLSADEFIHLDDVLLIEEIPDDMILIEQIRCEQDDEDAQSDEEDDSTTELCKFSLQEGKQFAKNLVQFLLQQNDEFGISVEELEVVRHISEIVKRKEMNSRRQVSLMQFFKTSD